MDRDPNQLSFTLRCEHCVRTFKSQGSLRAHLKHGEPRCRRFCIRCGCCAELFLSKEQLAAHLNQPGAYKRPSIMTPTPTTSTTSYAPMSRVTTATTCTVTRAAPPQAAPHSLGSRQPTAQHPAPPTRPSQPLGAERTPPRIPDPIPIFEDWPIITSSPPALSLFELISPAPAAPVSTVASSSSAPQRQAPPGSAPFKPRPAAATPPPRTPGSPDTTDAEGDQPEFLLRDRTRAPRDRSRSPLQTGPSHQATETAAGAPAFRLDQPADYLYWVSLQYQLATGLGGEFQQAQFTRMDTSLRTQIAVDSGPLGAAADQPFHILLHTLSPVFAIWHLTGHH